MDIKAKLKGHKGKLLIGFGLLAAAGLYYLWSRKPAAALAAPNAVATGNLSPLTTIAIPSTGQTPVGYFTPAGAANYNTEIYANSDGTYNFYNVNTGVTQVVGEAQANTYMNPTPDLGIFTPA